MVEKSYGTPAKQRTVYRLSGLSANVSYGVHNNNLANLRRGLMERVFNVETGRGLAPPPRPADGVFAAKMSGFMTQLGQYIEMTVPCTYDDFVKLYAGDRRQKVYSQAVESLLLKEVEPRDAWMTTFVKAEKVNLTKKPDPAPRVIQPRTPRYNVEVGRYLKKLEKKLYRWIAAVFGEVTVLKGYNAADSGRLLREKWEKYNRPVAVGLDASRFDQHVSKQALEWEHKVYSKCFYPSDRKKLARLLSWQVRNRGVARASDGHIRYQVEGCRMSGDMNTAMGNCLLMSAMVWTYLQEKGIDASLANNGDDCVVVMEKADLASFMCGLPEWFRELGFSMKVEDPVDTFERIEFCQTKPLWTPRGWVMCRDGLVAMAKDCHSVLPLGQGNMALGWCTAIGECGMALSGGVPIFQEFYSAMLRCGRGVRIGQHPALESGFARLAAGMKGRWTEVAPETRVSFWEAFGILPSVQESIERRLAAAIANPLTTLRRDISEDLSLLLTLL
jgi:hypothetical protein